jgi:pimeloyl-ACP methyl ester carboxylesterase
MRLGIRTPDFGGWFLAQLATMARRSPDLFFRVITARMPDVDRRALAVDVVRRDFLTNYHEAFAQGSGGVAQDLRILTRPWGFEIDEITVPTVIHQGSVDTTVPPAHARRYAAAIPGAQLRVHPGHGHFSIPARSDWRAVSAETGAGD